MSPALGFLLRVALVIQGLCVSVCISQMIFLFLCRMPLELVFEAIENGIVSLISFSVYSLLVYRKVTDFYMLILYSATLLKEFMISNSILVEFWGLLGIGSCKWG
jgi:hypothetical protein